jgi:hypothetical protein
MTTALEYRSPHAQTRARRGNGWGYRPERLATAQVVPRDLPTRSLCQQPLRNSLTNRGTRPRPAAFRWRSTLTSFRDRMGLMIDRV